MTATSRIYTVLFFVFLLLPAAVAIPASFSATPVMHFPPQGLSLHWYGAFFSDPTWMHATLVSLRIGGAAALLAILTGVPAALAIARYRLPGKRVLMAAMMIPVVVPTVVLGTALFSIALRLSLLDSMWTVVIAHAALALPIVILLVATALQRLDSALEDAAHSLGAGRIMTFRKVMLPAILPSVMVSAILALIVSWDEVVLASFLLSVSTSVTLPVQVFSYLRDAVTPTPAAISTMLLAVSGLGGLAILIVRRLIGVGGEPVLPDQNTTR